VHAATGQRAEAVKEHRAYLGDKNLPPTNPTAKGYAQLIKDDVTQRNRRGRASGIWWATASAAEGDREGAIGWLQKAAANLDSEFPYEIRNPLFDFVRSDARYVELMRRVGLPP
jgi:hypothetical protein